MKVKLNPMFDQVSGQLGDLVFREVRGETVASRKPTTNGNEPTEEQAAQRDRFKQAVAYGRFVMADNGVRETYEQAAKSRNIPVFALTVADFLNLPSIEAIDLSGYSGQAGNPILITTSDDFGVVNVVVTLRSGTGDAFDGGQAVETSGGSGRWTYTARTSIPAGTDVTVQVAASDHPGGITVKSVSKTI